jgi:hypothetical protein
MSQRKTREEMYRNAQAALGPAKDRIEVLKKELAERTLALEAAKEALDDEFFDITVRHRVDTSGTFPDAQKKQLYLFASDGVLLELIDRFETEPDAVYTKLETDSTKLSNGVTVLTGILKMKFVTTGTMPVRRCDLDVKSAEWECIDCIFICDAGPVKDVLTGDVVTRTGFMPELESFGAFLEDEDNVEIKQVGDWDSPCFEATVRTQEYSMFLVSNSDDSDTESEEQSADQAQEKRQKTTE